MSKTELKNLFNQLILKPLVVVLLFELLQNSIMRHTRKYFDYKIATISKSVTDRSISYLFNHFRLIQ